MAEMLHPYYAADGSQIGWSFVCPACGYRHDLQTVGRNASGAQWHFNGDLDAPTFQPSYVERVGPWPEGCVRNGRDLSGTTEVCHFHLRSGTLYFCQDCTHSYAGKMLRLASGVEGTNQL